MSLPLNLRITSPGSMPAFSAGLPFSTELTRAPAGLSSPKDSANCWFTSWIVTPKTFAAHLAVVEQLTFDFHGDIDRDGER